MSLNKAAGEAEAAWPENVDEAGQGNQSLLECSGLGTWCVVTYRDLFAGLKCRK